MKKYVREPLFHFLLIGASLFALYAWRGNHRGASRVRPDRAEIVVSEGKIRSLAETFTTQWRRPPTGEEMAGMIRDYVREEAFMREALALGLDRDDTIVRRRLAQKMEFLFEDPSAVGGPTENELRDYLAQHSEKFAVDFRLSFSQVFLDPGKHGKALLSDVQRLRTELNASSATPDIAALSESRMLDVHYTDLSRREIETQFGPAFASALEKLPVGAWQGPIQSGYGIHLVRVERLTPEAVPALDQVRAAVVREWTAAKSKEMKQALLAKVLARYKVTIANTTGVANASQIAQVKP